MLLFTNNGKLPGLSFESGIDNTFSEKRKYWCSRNIIQLDVRYITFDSSKYSCST